VEDACLVASRIRAGMNDIFLNDYSLAVTPTRANTSLENSFLLLVFVPGLLGGISMSYGRQDQGQR
jgi:hypothetical protein